MSEVDSSSGVSWGVAVGEELVRSELHKRFHGSGGRGISAPGRRYMPGNIMLFWRPERGHLFGYEDGWTEDGDTFFFTGMGQYGDQEFGGDCPENGRLRDHLLNGERVRLFEHVRDSTWRYVDELALDTKAPWAWADGPDRLGEVRRVIQFRLVKVASGGDAMPPAVRSTAQQTTIARTKLPSLPKPPSVTDLEALGKASFERLLTVRSLEVRRAELELVHAFASWLEAVHGYKSSGLNIPYALGAKPLRADLYVTSENLVVEAKANTSREALRTALGQLLDYRRFLHPTPSLMVLTPEEPADDMKELLAEFDVRPAWQTPGGFAGTGLS